MSNQIHNDDSNLIERTKMEGTPFTMIRQTMDNNKEKYFIVMGDHRLTEPTNEEQAQWDKLVHEEWLITTNLIAIITAKMLEKQQQPYETESL